MHLFWVVTVSVICPLAWRNSFGVGVKKKKTSPVKMLFITKYNAQDAAYKYS